MRFTTFAIAALFGLAAAAPATSGEEASSSALSARGVSPLTPFARLSPTD